MRSSFLTADLDHYALIAADSAGLADAAAGNLGAPVEHCPGWSVADLVRHVWEVHAFWGQIVELQLADPDDFVPPPDPTADALLDSFRAGAARLVDILRAADPATPVWTWASQRDAGFVIRHQVQEAAVHRWDAEHAAGRAFVIHRDAAVDSIEEFLQFSLGQHPPQPLDGPLALVATDADAAWTLRPGADGALNREPGIGDDATQARATASDLLLWLYRRRTAAQLEITGDAGALQRFTAYAATD
jgi:uncharacterized protein (TIGR03083 family)